MTFADVAGADEAVAELQEIKEFLEAPAQVPGHRGQDPQGRAALRAARDRQDAAGPGRGRRGRRAVLLHLRLRLRGDVRRRGRQPGARPVRAGQGQRPGDHLHRRDRRGRPPPRRRPRRRPRRARADPQPAARRDGRLRRQGRDHPDRRHQPARHPRPGPAPPRPLRPPDRRRPARPRTAAGPSSTCTPRASRSPPGVNLDVLARRTPGFTGADLANLLNEAALLAARHNLQQIGMRELEEAIDRVIAGPERKTRGHERQGEAGHRLPRERPRPRRPRAAPRRPDPQGLDRGPEPVARPDASPCPEDKYNHSRSELRDTMAMCLGRPHAPRSSIFDEPTTGRRERHREGHRDRPGHGHRVRHERRCSGPSSSASAKARCSSAGSSGISPTTPSRWRPASTPRCAGCIDEAHGRARDILIRHRDTLDLLAAALVEKETLEASELMEIIGSLPTWSSPPPIGRMPSSGHSGASPAVANAFNREAAASPGEPAATAHAETSLEQPAAEGPTAGGRRPAPRPSPGEA